MTMHKANQSSHKNIEILNFMVNEQVREINLNCLYIERSAAFAMRCLFKNLINFFAMKNTSSCRSMLALL